MASGTQADKTPPPRSQSADRERRSPVRGEKVKTPSRGLAESLSATTLAEVVPTGLNDGAPPLLMDNGPRGAWMYSNQPFSQLPAGIVPHTWQNPLGLPAGMTAGTCGPPGPAGPTGLLGQPGAQWIPRNCPPPVHVPVPPEHTGYVRAEQAQPNGNVHHTSVSG